jgi:hypothetical protein
MAREERRKGVSFLSFRGCSSLDDVLSSTMLRCVQPSSRISPLSAEQFLKQTPSTPPSYTDKGTKEEDIKQGARSDARASSGNDSRF